VIEQKALVTLTMALLLSGCFETKEEIAAREAQFNGKTVSQVATIIGKPIAQDKSKAIWQYNSSYTRSEPITQFINGNWITVGYRNVPVNVGCTFTATLSAGRVKTSTYAGNRCERYAPKLKKL
jgi:outer membrane protein assembly factor BamE (lipoprotein component of BamABCDE complex)